MRLTSAYGSKNEPCCDTMRKALSGETVDMPDGSDMKHPVVVGLYTGCDAFTLRVRPHPFLEGDKDGEHLEACPWCGEKVEDCFAGSAYDYPHDVKLIGENPERDCDVCVRSVAILAAQRAKVGAAEEPSVYKRVIGSNRMQLCPRHYDAFEAWFKINSRVVTTDGIGWRVWLPQAGSA